MCIRDSRYHELYYVVKNKQHTGEFLKEGDGKNIVSGRDEEDGGKEDGDTSDTRTCLLYTST